ncbi:pyroglutamyl-peptidase I [Variovorax dokdonensis]|uniref:Pyrrolidone-carboxylate peptidase n=1 Tax=Variovorax dokdonensis TaxID=344883 RepID=A0ABT7NBK4_9BURK|nr:pyroglutamyl-peptidase I [Variovorax dokdonensis]MDM0045306.1 pyroglutamyl-peptidase I [Variovorax dokdonensis]
MAPNSQPVLQVLVTGFEPFDADRINPSWEAARRLDGWQCDLGEGKGAAVVHARRMPCVFGAALTALDAAIDELQPDLVLCLGLAGGRSEITPERVAINVDDGRICDNAGCQPIDQPVVPGAPAGYFSSLPIKAVVNALRAAGIPASVSNSAGTFVCNHLFFGLMHRMATRPSRPGMRGGFIHVPLLPEQAARLPGALPSLALDTLVEGLRISVRTSLTVQTDLRETGGALH